MKGWRALFLFWMGFPALLSAAHFDFFAAYHRGTSSNVTAWVNLGPQLAHVDRAKGTLLTEVEVTLQAWTPNKRQLVSERKWRARITPESFGGKDPNLLQYEFTLPEGEFLLIAEVNDRITGRKTVAEQLLNCPAAAAGFELSGISLWQQREGDPMAFPVLNAPVNGGFKGEWLRFNCEVYVPRGEAYTARALLYRRDNPDPARRTDYAALPVQTFSSIAQFTAARRSFSERTSFSESFNIAKLEAGEYLLEVYLYAGDSLVADESRAFAIEWREMRRVYGDLQASIDALQYLTTPTEVKEMQSLTDAESRIARFNEFWQRRSSDAPGAIRQYYSLVYEANENFTRISASDTLAGWQTDRGRVLCLYGRPTRREVLRKAGLNLSVWGYDNWKLEFVFDEKGNLM